MARPLATSRRPRVTVSRDAIEGSTPLCITQRATSSAFGAAAESDGVAGDAAIRRGFTRSFSVAPAPGCGPKKRGTATAVTVPHSCGELDYGLVAPAVAPS